jgi:hypothetical protein
MRQLAKGRRWWFVIAAALAIVAAPLVFGGPAALAQLSCCTALFFSLNPAAPGDVVRFSTGEPFAFIPGSTMTCTATGRAVGGGTIPPLVQTFTAAANGTVSGTIVVPATALPGSSLVMKCLGVPGGEENGVLTVVAGAPPAIPEADVLTLFGAGLAGLGGYAAVRLRSLRRG